MRQFNTRYGTIDISEGILVEEEENLGINLFPKTGKSGRRAEQRIRENYWEREIALLQLFSFYLESSTNHHPRSPRMLDAHGEVIAGVWVYYDNTEARPVQEWLDEHKENHDALYLLVCNAKGNIPQQLPESYIILPHELISQYGLLTEIEKLTSIRIPQLGIR
ncbi:MAG TPA: hypothetical protein VJC39_05235 [Candidatus Nanoarchaeia archaeon]|nr:hypothetical protein [Candidatus Nanoarchaeia archaeon]